MKGDDEHQMQNRDFHFSGREETEACIGEFECFSSFVPLRPNAAQAVVRHHLLEQLLEQKRN